mgnify:CR=1 FL=1
MLVVETIAKTRRLYFAQCRPIKEMDLPGKSGGTSDSIIATGGLYDDQTETRIYAGV